MISARYPYVGIPHRPQLTRVVLGVRDRGDDTRAQRLDLRATLREQVRETGVEQPERAGGRDVVVHDDERLRSAHQEVEHPRFADRRVEDEQVGPAPRGVFVRRQPDDVVFGVGVDMKCEHVRLDLRAQCVAVTEGKLGDRVARGCTDEDLMDRHPISAWRSARSPGGRTRPRSSAG